MLGLKLLETNRKESYSVRVQVYSSGRHRDAGPSSVSEIHAGGHSALAKRRFERSVFVNLGAISASVGDQRGASGGALRVRVFDPGGSAGCLDTSNRHLRKVHSRGAVGVELLTVTPVDEPVWSDPRSDLTAEVVQKIAEWTGILRVISLVDRQGSNGIEGTNKQFLRHVRTLVHDLRVPKKWSDPTMLSQGLFAVNGRVDSETGVRPLDSMFGSDDNPYLRLPDSVDPSSITSTWPVVGDFFEEKKDTPWGQAEYLVEEVYLARPEHVLDQVSAHMDRSDAELLICIEAVLGGQPQHNVTSVESTPGVLAGSSKRVQGASSKGGHEPAEGSDLMISHCGDRLAERDLDIRRLEPQTSLRQRSCGTQPARRSSAARDAHIILERSHYSWWIGSSDQGSDSVPLVDMEVQWRGNVVCGCSILWHL